MNILELIEQETHLSFAKRGREYHGQCPFCRCEGKQFIIFTTGKPRYFCRSCDRKGDAVQFLHDFCHYTYRQAKERMGIVIDNNDYHDKNDKRDKRDNRHHNETQPLQPPGEVWVSLACTFVENCQVSLWADMGAKARAWLRKRALSDDTVHQAGLGYNDHDHYVDRQSWGLPEEKDEKGRIKGLWLPRGIVIPWYVGGALWGIRIRRPPGTGDPKYYFVPGGQANAMYNADTISPGKAAAIFEGEIDALTTMQHAGDQIAAVATGSTHAARRLRWIARLSTASTVLVCYDSDQAGDRAASYWIDALPNARRWRPYWSDANDMAQDGVDLHKWVIAGLPGAAEPPTQPTTDFAPEPPEWLTNDESDWMPEAEATPADNQYCNPYELVESTEYLQPAAISPAEKMLALSNKLDFIWERLPDGRIWLSRWDAELFREARQLIAAQ